MQMDKTVGAACHNSNTDNQSPSTNDTREREQAPSHAICKVCDIILEMVRDVSITVSLFLNKELVVLALANPV